MKRILDLFLSSFGLLLFAPALSVLFVLIIVTSGRPAIFAQARVGRNEQLFSCYKLRTMRTDTPSCPSHELGLSAVTPVGRYLRRTKFDEVPQLWNVLKGDMSIVGPRPCLPQQEKLIELRRLNNVYSVRPGITGLAQIRLVDMSNPELLAELDGVYVRSMSFSQDLSIIVATVRGLGHRGGPGIGLV